MIGFGGNILFGGFAYSFGQRQARHIHVTQGVLRRESLRRECEGAAPESAIWSSLNPGYRGAAVDTNHKLHLRHLSHTFHEWPLHTQVYNLQWSGVLVCS